jgi:flavin reductase (DIM6/NTAB) family NADH-FMN oxidoreductase RutF
MKELTPHVQTCSKKWERGEKMNYKTLHKISYGLYVVSSKKENKINGQIANTVFQVTSEPPTIAVSINKQNLTHQFIQESRKFAISILSKETPMKFIGHFGFKSGREINKFKDVNYKVSNADAPIVLDNAIAYLAAEVIEEANIGTHTIFIGKVVETEIFKDKEPMTYAYYNEVKRGKTPKAAPTYIKEETKKEVEKIEEG